MFLGHCTGPAGLYNIYIYPCASPLISLEMPMVALALVFQMKLNKTKFANCLHQASCPKYVREQWNANLIT